MSEEVRIIETHLQMYCHEYRAWGSIRKSYGFGETPELAREKAIYDSENPIAVKDYCLGFGDWVIKESSNGYQWIDKVPVHNKPIYIQTIDEITGFYMSHYAGEIDPNWIRVGREPHIKKINGNVWFTAETYQLYTDGTIEVN